tara:strand:- start:5663 stop:6469 length:807 start_codon:yes stop_codon:yes gene_type:complete
MFFIIGCARSGTTAIAKILDSCQNVNVGIELKPNLCIESRNLFDGNLKKDPREILIESREKQIMEAYNNDNIFADKNVNYLPFIPTMEEIWSPKFLFVIRNGKDVVRSLMDWDNFSSGNIFGRKEDDSTSNIINPDEDWWDYSRIRPQKGEKYYENWQDLSKFEKCSWYWNKYNKELLNASKIIPQERKMFFDISKCNSKNILKIMNFFNLNIIEKDKINHILNQRVNSTRDRYNKDQIFPKKEDWSLDLNSKFISFASEMYNELGYE